ncbi:MAG TPA: GNAT family N-acetyltransferase [Beijerinckiaceae bacterium]|jgi:GNAT superfamily N-acetyltransferase
MKTHFIGQEEVSAYALDFARRLVLLGTFFPRKWIYVGRSGKIIADEVLRQLPSAEADSVYAVGALYDRKAKTFSYLSEITAEDFEPGETVLLIDSAIHTGSSLLCGLRSLADMGVHNVLTYGLAVKRGSHLIPTYFGVLIDDWDRALFQLELIPNNRLAETPPFGTLRLLTREHAAAEFGALPKPFVGLSGGDLLYNDHAYGMRTYVYELEGRIVGFVSFAEKGGVAFIDAWATCSDHQNKGIGAATLRWAETWARAANCHSIELWAFEDAVPIYERFNYRKSSPQALDLGQGGRFQLMAKSIMHHGDRGH